MPVISNTFQSPSAKGNREELSDVVNRIDPEDTPIYSMISKGSTNSTFPEWETDSLSAPAANVQLEGDQYTFGATSPVVRMRNYTQIMRKDGILSKTQEAINNAGRAEQIKYQKLKKGVELRKDIEFALVSNTASVGGATRQFGGLPSWITSNVSRGASGANGGYNTGTNLTVAETTGTQRAFTKTLLDTTMQTGYTNGANFRSLVVSPYVKSVFVTFMSDTNVAAFRYAASNGKNNSIVANADVYEGPFGKVTVVPNRVMATSAAVARRAFLLDPEYASFMWLRKIHEDKSIAINADANAFVLIGEGTLKVKNEKGLGVIADVFGLTAAS